MEYNRPPRFAVVMLALIPLLAATCDAEPSEADRGRDRKLTRSS
jgi:hypothetical protein